jgi:hypothetical protein
MAQDQVFVTVGSKTRHKWEQWCGNNAYVARKVFLAGWMQIADMEHEQRAELFAKCEAWADKLVTDDFGERSAGHVSTSPKPDAASASKPGKKSRTA